MSSGPEAQVQHSLGLLYLKLGGYYSMLASMPKALVCHSMVLQSSHMSNVSGCILKPHAMIASLQV